MKEISTKKITEEVAKLCVEANIFIDEKLLQAFNKFKEIEESENGKIVFSEIIENAEIAKKDKKPICQDTGIAVVFVEIGQEVHIIDGSITDAINEGVKKGYKEGYLRKSVVDNPLTRKNTGDNTPAIIHYEIVPGDKLKITVAPKGAGSENMSALKMLKPSEGWEGIKKFVKETVEIAGPNPCPPIIIGVGIGGNFEKVALLAKKALLRDIGEHNPDSNIAKLEDELLKVVNSTGIGPQGYGGRITAIQVNIEVYSCHIASLPVAVNINCHVARHKKIIL